MRDRLKTLILAFGAALTALFLMCAPQAMAYPSGTNSTWQTAKIDAQLKPEFRALIRDGRYRPVGHLCDRGGRWYGSSHCCLDQYGYSYRCQGDYGVDCVYGGHSSDPYRCWCPEGLAPDGAGGCMCADSGQYPDQNMVCPTIYQPQTYGLEQHVTLDCREPAIPGTDPMREALERLADGGTLHLKGRGPSCTGTLQLHRPVVIEGEPRGVYPLDGDAGKAMITVPPGAACAIIDAGTRGGVEFRHVGFDAPQAGRTACIQAVQTQVAFVGGSIHYKGESSAVYIQGGQLQLLDTDVTAASLDPAIWAEGASMVIRGSGISAAGTGIDVTPAPGQAIRLDHVHIVGIGSGQGGDPSSGFIGRRAVAGGDCDIDILDSHIEGFRTGLLFERGLHPKVIHARIVRSRMGVAVDGALVNIKDSLIEATEYGAYAYSGDLEVHDTSVASVLRCPIAGDAEAGLHLYNIDVFADHCACRGVGPGLGTRAEAGLHFHLRAELKLDLGVSANLSARRYGWDR